MNVINTNPLEFLMTSVSVLYTNNTCSTRFFSITDKFIDLNTKEDISPQLSHYAVVTTDLKFDDTIENIINQIIKSHNIGSYPSVISDKIKSGEINATHSSISSGDVVKIDGCYYLIKNFGYELLPLEFSEN